MNPSTIFEAALALPEDARLELVEQLLETLGPETDRLDEASFLEELRRRSGEIDQGTTEVVPWSALKNEPF